MHRLIVISTNWNIEKEKDREKEKIGDSQAKINEKKNDGELEQEIRSHFLLEEQTLICSSGEKMTNASGQPGKNERQ